jgi:integrase
MIFSLQALLLRIRLLKRMLNGMLRFRRLRLVTISKHAVERLRERLPNTKDWSEEVLLRRVRDALDTAVVQDLKADGSIVWLGKIKSTAAYSIPLFLVERNEVIVSVYT